MKIAISATGKDLNSNVDPRFGRCPFFLIIDIKDKKIKQTKTIENIAANQAGGAGIKAAEIVAQQNVDSVIATNIGPRAFQVFQQLKIKIYEGEGKIKDVIKEFIEGKLKETKKSTGPQHMGMQR